MISANELRIGNCVEHVFNGARWQITLSDFFEEYTMGQAMFHMKPIILTPEILEKAGFISDFKDKNIFPHKDYNNIRQNDWFEVIIKDNKYYLKQANINWDKDFYFNQIESLHQLQNLYFALTNSELEIHL